MRAAALIRVRMQVCGLGMPGPKAAWLDQAGWTVARYADVGRILDRAAAVHGADVEPRRVPLVEAAEETVVHRMTWAEVVPWLEVLAVEPVQYLSQTLVRRSNEREVFGYVGMVEDLRFAWTGIPDEVAALAYAAGLEPQRVRAEIEAGQPDLATVRAMAESRGDRLPAVA